MTDASYEAPKTLKGAIKILTGANGRAAVLAGGTDLIIKMRTEIVEPSIIVDIKHIPELTNIQVKNGEACIGAAVTGVELSENQEIKDMWPGLVEAMELIGSTQIQGRATLGGNLCNGSPAADTVPALIAAGATAEIMGKNGIREIPVEEILVGPGKSKIKNDELLVLLRLPQRLPRSSDSYLRFIPRTEMDIAAVGVGANIALDNDGRCVMARIALGAVAEKALLLPEAESVLLGTRIEDHAVKELSEKAKAICRPIDDKRGTKEFRTHVAGTLVSRATKIAFERARIN